MDSRFHGNDGQGQGIHRGGRGERRGGCGFPPRIGVRSRLCAGMTVWVSGSGGEDGRPQGSPLREV